MKFKVLTLFPEMFDGFATSSIMGRAIREEKISFQTIQIRDYTTNKHNRVDDTPYGGGAGMVMQVQPLRDALQTGADHKPGTPVIYLTPKGQPLTQALARDLSQEEEICLVCGHYEGIDQRFIDQHVTHEVSIGDYVLTGGELPAMVLIDTVARLLPGVIGKSVSYEDESHYNGLLEYPHYTRPPEIDGAGIPDVLLSGHHANIEKWRFEESVRLTADRRPDMIQKLLADPDQDEKTKKKVRDLLRTLK